MNSNYKKKIAKLFFSNYSPTFERLNNNTLFQDIVSNNTINISENKLLMKEAINERSNTAIDYLEFGVFEGKSIMEWMKLNTFKNSRFLVLIVLKDFQKIGQKLRRKDTLIWEGKNQR